MILYGSSLSPFARKVLAYAGEKGIEIELQPTGFPNHSPEYLEASPFRKMPALRDGDYTLADSSAIIHYLEAKFPEPALIPTDDLPMQDDHHFNMLGHKLWAERAFAIMKDKGWSPWVTTDVPAPAP